MAAPHIDTAAAEPHIDTAPRPIGALPEPWRTSSDLLSAHATRRVFPTPPGGDAAGGWGGA
ncbi:hypothetical protein, partial [Streptomyces antimycoticus]|uniref:hypothetical protein n=1 Tax=Streptomyces antimycoticus TaxID=68175 RepID=UPI001F1A2867